jgi:hypothetical protein
MKTVDEVRGFEREILFSSTGGYATGGGIPLTNSVIEVKENDSQGRCPVLSLRFYHKPTYPHQFAQECAEAGRALYDENTPIGVEISLGPEAAQSLVEQIQAKWPEFIRVIQDVGE